jgi:hypothetical protein
MGKNGRSVGVGTDPTPLSDEVKNQNEFVFSLTPIFLNIHLKK